MGVYIQGMEMPSCCMFCPLSNSTGCGLSNPPTIMTSKEMLAGRPDWCPLIPVPPHGRLIDADAFTKDECNNCDGDCEALPCDCLNCDADCRCDFMKDIAEAPTIIPASEEGDRRIKYVALDPRQKPPKDGRFSPDWNYCTDGLPPMVHRVEFDDSVWYESDVVLIYALAENDNPTYGLAQVRAGELIWATFEEATPPPDRIIAWRRLPAPPEVL